MEDGINPTDIKREEKIKNLSVLDLYNNYEENFKTKVKVGERRQKSLDDIQRHWKLHVKPKVESIEPVK
jgi:hypothetical protein